MPTKEQHSIVVNGEALAFVLTRKSVKNINLRVQRDGSIAVSAHPRVPITRIEAFIRSQADFIEKARAFWREKAEKLPPRLTLATGEALPIHGKTRTVTVQKGKKRDFLLTDTTLILTVRDTQSNAERAAAFAAFLDCEARVTLTAATLRLLPLFYPTPSGMPTLTFRTMTSKWGVCRPTQNRVTLNRNLVYLPEALVDYVICHELAHFRHADHSERFWQYLCSVMPDCHARKKALNAFLLPRFDGQA